MFLGKKGLHNQTCDPISTHNPLISSSTLSSQFLLSTFIIMLIDLLDETSTSDTGSKEYLKINSPSNNQPKSYNKNIDKKRTVYH